MAQNRVENSRCFSILFSCVGIMQILFYLVLFCLMEPPTFLNGLNYALIWLPTRLLFEIFVIFFRHSGLNSSPYFVVQSEFGHQIFGWLTYQKTPGRGFFRERYIFSPTSKSQLFTVLGVIFTSLAFQMFAIFLHYNLFFYSNIYYSSIHFWCSHFFFCCIFFLFEFRCTPLYFFYLIKFTDCS